MTLRISPSNWGSWLRGKAKALAPQDKRFADWKRLLLKRAARFDFPQKANNLFFRKTLFHVQSPVVGIGLQAQVLLKVRDVGAQGIHTARQWRWVY